MQWALEDGTQRLLVIHNGRVLATFPGLSTGFQSVRWAFDPAFESCSLTLKGEQSGALPSPLSLVGGSRYRTDVTAVVLPLGRSYTRT